MIRRAILVAAAAVALILAPSYAMAYNAPGFSSSVSDSTPAIGAPVTVTVQGGAANAGQVIKLVITNTSTGSASTRSISQTANASGVVFFTFTLTAAGRYTVEAKNAAGALVSDQVLTVASQAASASPSPSPQLSHTGFDGMPLALGGGLLVLVGAGAVVVAKRRRSAQLPA
jgi:hypothetical protein